MKTKTFKNKILVRVDKGEELVESLTKIVKDNKIKLGTISGIGATDKVKVGLFNVETKEYYSNELTGNYEINPLYGNITTQDGETYLHLHINVADENHNSFGGHLNHAHISATFEGVIDIIDGEVDRKFDEEVGLNLLEM
jgi:hypothetical protein